MVPANKEALYSKRVPTPFGEGPTSGMAVSSDLLGSGAQDSVRVGKLHVRFFVSNLNPDAEEWYPYHFHAPEEDRCIFLTFSNGFPLTERQIYNFFSERYGPSCVERVYIHHPRQRYGPMQMQSQSPLFGKVVFRSALMPVIVLGGEEQVKFRIDRKPLWCKKFDKNKLAPLSKPLTYSFNVEHSQSF